MKRNIYSLIVALVAMFTLSSCINHGLEELDSFEGADITGVQGVYYRYVDETAVNPGSGQPAVKQVTLAKGVKVDSEAATVHIKWQEPSNFPAAQLPNLSAQKLVVVFNISTASTITPVDGAPRPGTPGDWSVARQYKVKAANGTEKVWTVTTEYVPR